MFNNWLFGIMICSVEGTSISLGKDEMSERDIANIADKVLPIFMYQMITRDNRCKLVELRDRPKRFTALFTKFSSLLSSHLKSESAYRKIRNYAIKFTKENLDNKKNSAFIKCHDTFIQKIKDINLSKYDKTEWNKIMVYIFANVFCEQLKADEKLELCKEFLESPPEKIIYKINKVNEKTIPSQNKNEPKIYNSKKRNIELIMDRSLDVNCNDFYVYITVIYDLEQIFIPKLEKLYSSKNSRIVIDVDLSFWYFQLLYDFLCKINRISAESINEKVAILTNNYIIAILSKALELRNEKWYIDLQKIIDENDRECYLMLNINLKHNLAILEIIDVITMSDTKNAQEIKDCFKQEMAAIYQMNKDVGSSFLDNDLQKLADLLEKRIALCKSKSNHNADYTTSETQGKGPLGKAPVYDYLVAIADQNSTYIKRQRLDLCLNECSLFVIGPNNYIF